MKSNQTVHRVQGRPAKFSIERVADTEAERYLINSVGVVSGPSYRGSLELFGFVAQVAIGRRNNPNPQEALLLLSPEESLYARSDEIVVRGWAAHQVARRAVLGFLEGGINSDPEALALYESFSAEKIAGMRAHALAAV